MYLVKTPKFIQEFFPNLNWKIPTQSKRLFLTFDDGPIPNVTPWVLDMLDQFQAKASFFCVGDNVKKYPDIYNSVRNAGHQVGNHTFNHLNGWSTNAAPYCENVAACSDVVDSKLFRPPYGRIRPAQASLLKKHYEIIMWDILSGDFDPKISKYQCLNNVIHHAKPGSIIVFHDSLKAFDKLKFVLPKVLEHFSQRGYSFESLNSKKIEATRLKKTA